MFKAVVYNLSGTPGDRGDSTIKIELVTEDKVQPILLGSSVVVCTLPEMDRWKMFQSKITEKATWKIGDGAWQNKGLKIDIPEILQRGITAGDTYEVWIAKIITKPVLLPCPHCGEKGVYKVNLGILSHPGYYVACDSCPDSETSVYPTELEAGNAWNKRFK